MIFIYTVENTKSLPQYTNWDYDDIILRKNIVS